MADNVRPQDTNVYAKVDYNGYIPILNAHGPIRACWLKKTTVKELIRSGYKVIFPNRSGCPEFCDQMDAYKKYIDAKDYIGAEKLLASPFAVFGKDPNSPVETALRTVIQQPIQPQPVHRSDDVVANALRSAGVEPPTNSSTEIIAHDDEVPRNSAGEPIVDMGEAESDNPDNPFAEDLGRIEAQDDGQPHVYAKPVQSKRHRRK